MASMKTEPQIHPQEAGAQIRRYPRILVVDDNQDNLDLVSEQFEDEPWEVRTIDNVQDAWQLIKDWRPDLALLDIQMPDLNGHHLCTAIRMRKEFDELPVIFLTAKWTSEQDRERGLRMGANDYICKPIDGESLRKRVRAVLQPIWLKHQAEQDAHGKTDEGGTPEPA